MVLSIGDQMMKEMPLSIGALYSLYPRLKESAHTLTSTGLQPAGTRGILYLRQREYALTIPADENVQYLGTDDATTSIMAVLRNTANGAIGLAHFDKCSHTQCLEAVRICTHNDGVMHFIQRILELSIAYTGGKLELSVIGGFQDTRRISERVTLSLINAFYKNQDANVHLVSLCTGEMNTYVQRNISFPIIKGIGVSTVDGKLFPATFTDKGPDFVLRSTRNFTGGHQMVEVYDCTQGLLRIGPFNYEPHGGVEILLQQTDSVILQCLSTTPEVEGPDFVKMVRDALKHIKDHPFPSITIYPDNRPHYFRRDSLGTWIQVDLPNNNDSTPDANLQAVTLQQVSTWTPPGTVTTTSNAPPQSPMAPHPVPWNTTIPTRYPSFQLDCRLKTHLSVPPVVNSQHYDDHVLNPTKDRFMPTWQTSQL